jgi:hypothetical protein
MNCLFRASAALVLVASLVLTTLAAGVARGQAAPVGTVEICRGLTVVSVPVDADGAPVSPLHLCADGVTALYGETSVAAPAVAPPVSLQPITSRGMTSLAPRFAAHTPRARDPPLRA